MYGQHAKKHPNKIGVIQNQGEVYKALSLHLTLWLHSRVHEKYASTYIYLHWLKHFRVQ